MNRTCRHITEAAQSKLRKALRQQKKNLKCRLRTILVNINRIRSRNHGVVVVVVGL